MVLSGCGTGTNLEATALRAAKENARDPNSVLVRNVRLQKVEMGGIRAICGQVNSRNGSGGMSGWTEFGVRQDGTHFHVIERKPQYDDAGWAYILETNRSMCDDVW